MNTNELSNQYRKLILRTTGAKAIVDSEAIQNLWSGYGLITRYRLEGSKFDTIIVKHIHPPSDKEQSKRGDTDRSHKRKLRSYAVETAWYREWSRLCDEDCRVPQCLVIETTKNEVFMILEDLDAAGFDQRRDFIPYAGSKVCLKWLANFHATFMNTKPLNLWKVGTYWHLDTRPDELAALTDEPLKKAAAIIDQKLKACEFKTFVHGDAKLANFCFTRDGKQTAAVDFQYVGGGCGMKDVAYLISSCFSEKECESFETGLLDEYFCYLTEALRAKQPTINAAAVEKEWRALFPLAWTDFHRFFKGWSQGRWHRSSYSEKLSRQVLDSL